VSRKGQRSWPKAVGSAILFLIVLYGVVTLDIRKRSSQGPARRTTYSTAAFGYKALYLWLRELGLPVKRWEKPLGNLPDDASVILIAEPELGPGIGELKALTNWVSCGHTLILVAMRPNRFLDHFGLETTLPGSNHDEKEKPQEVLFQPGPYTKGVRILRSKGSACLSSPRPEVVIHARSQKGGLIAAAKEGRGRIVAVADPALFANGALFEGDHARLALNLLLSHLREGALLVDEYHHGYGRATSVLGHLARSPTMTPLLQGGLLLLILWAWKGRRFGSPRPLPRLKHRSSLEYVEAMAQLFRKVKARGDALEGVARGVEEEAKRVLVDKDLDFRAAMESAHRRVHDRQMTERELLTLVRSLYEALRHARERAPGGMGGR